jgi:3-dehydroquinate synthase
MFQDKKVKDGRIAFILVRGLGQAFIARNVEISSVESLLKDALTV